MEKCYIYQFGVVIDNDTVISKYYEEDGVLLKESIGKAPWSSYEALARGGQKCSDHAVERYNKGESVGQGKEDIYPDHFIYSNCQHFVDDCLLQQDGEGKCSEEWESMALTLMTVRQNEAFKAIIKKKYLIYKTSICSRGPTENISKQMTDELKQGEKKKFAEGSIKDDGMIASHFKSGKKACIGTEDETINLTIEDLPSLLAYFRQRLQISDLRVQFMDDQNENFLVFGQDKDKKWIEKLKLYQH